jgi:hypothetical protein
MDTATHPLSKAPDEKLFGPKSDQAFPVTLENLHGCFDERLLTSVLIMVSRNYLLIQKLFFQHSLVFSYDQKVIQNFRYEIC